MKKTKELFMEIRERNNIYFEYLEEPNTKEKTELEYLNEFYEKFLLFINKQ